MKTPRRRRNLLTEDSKASFPFRSSLEPKADPPTFAGELFHTLANFVAIKTIADDAHREDCRQGALYLKRALRGLGAETVVVRLSTSWRMTALTLTSHSSPVHPTRTRSFSRLSAPTLRPGQTASRRLVASASSSTATMMWFRHPLQTSGRTTRSRWPARTAGCTAVASRTTRDRSWRWRRRRPSCGGGKKWRSTW